MPSVKVNIQPEIIDWALSQTREEQLGSRLMDNIKKWLEGTKTPTFNQIEDFSKKSNIPLGYFFLQTPPVEKISLLDFRTIDSIELANPSRNLIDTIHEMEQVREWMKDYRIDTGFDVLSYVGSLKDHTDVNNIADIIRKDIQLDVDWYNRCDKVNEAFNYIRSLLDQCCIIVMMNGIVGKNTHRALNVDEFRAFAMADKWAPLIFINSADSHKARLFSLFHEMAHIWLGVDDLYNDRKQNSNVSNIETICNGVASELMVPKESFYHVWDLQICSDIFVHIKSVANIFNCSDIVIARRAFDNGFISKNIYDEVVNNSIEEYRKMKEKGDSSGGSYYNTMKTRLDGGFVRAIYESLNSGRITYTEAYRLTNTSSKTFPEIINRLGGVSK